MSPHEQLDAEFYTRISQKHARWFIERRNRALLLGDDEITQFLTELQIPFPLQNYQLFWTIVYFTRKLLFPQDAKSNEHLKLWLERTGFKCIHNPSRPLRKPRIQYGQIKDDRGTVREQVYVLPVELYWTPGPKAVAPPHAEPDKHINGELLLDSNPLLEANFTGPLDLP